MCVLRILRRFPAFTLVAIATLALGIRANSAMFSVVNGVLLRGLPYPQPDKLVFIVLRTAKDGSESNAMGVADFLALESRQRSFQGVAAFSQTDGLALTGKGTPAQIAGTTVTGDFFAILGVKPLLGRTFLPGEDKPGEPGTVVVSQRFWRQHLNSDPNAMGEELTIDAKPYTVIGVMRGDFHFGAHDDDEIWPVMQLEPLNHRFPYFLHVIGRLKPGATEAQAVTDTSEIARDVQKQFPDSPYSGAGLHSMKEVLVGDVRIPLLILLGAVGLVLLIAVVNVANLQMARASAREREMAIRSALGASSFRLAVQLLTENILLAMIGAALALSISHWSIDLLRRMAANAVPRLDEVTVDGRVLAFTALIALLSGILFGLVPVMRLRPAGISETLKDGGRSGTASSARRLHNLLVISEFALALVLLVGAGLLIRSLYRLESVSPGFRPDHLITMQLSLPAQRYGDSTKVTAFYQELLGRTENLPDVKSAAISESLPPNLLAVMNPFYLPGEHPMGEAPRLAEEIPISPGYFQTLAVPLLRGRTFVDADRGSATGLLIINESLANRYFPGQNPVGKSIFTGDYSANNAPESIIGVVGDVKYEGLDKDKSPTLYAPYFEEGWSPFFVRSMFVIVRTGGDPHQIVASVRSAVWGVDKDLPVTNVRTMEDLLTASAQSNHFRATLFAILAALALVLAAIGIYGVTSYPVSQRTQEIGIRVTLGARPIDVIRLVIGQAAKLALSGVVLGLVLSLALARLIATLLFDTNAMDPVTLLGVAVLLTLVAVAAAYIPARRAVRVDPMTALRHE